MNKKSYSTKLDNALKPVIAKDLGIRPLNQNFNIDYISGNGNMIELKIRRFRENEKNKSFFFRKNQYDIFKNRYTNSYRVFGRDANFRKPILTYLLLGYNSNKKIDSIKKIDEIINDMEIENLFLVDYKFVEKNNSGGEKSRHFRVKVDELENNVMESICVNVLGKETELKTVGKKDYITQVLSDIICNR
ncbi:MAG: hypothetical protein JW700_00990 [Candidatus Aenigmarchaeota archaeon]|nr:hypothetical protein [Candidatus Aenigmarchaeota archaeon]